MSLFVSSLLSARYWKRAAGCASSLRPQPCQEFMQAVVHADGQGCAQQQQAVWWIDKGGGRWVIIVQVTVAT